MVPSNPFATRYTRPGQLEPLDAEGRPIDLPALLQECARLGRAVAIVGPHGSGKSTLLRRLYEATVAAVLKRGEFHVSRPKRFFRKGKPVVTPAE